MKRITRLSALSLMTMVMFAAATAIAHEPKEHDPKTPAQQHDMGAMHKDGPGLAAHFDMLDTNKDGSLSRAEFAKLHQMMKGMHHGKMDMHKGGMGHGKMPDHPKFATLDKNKDGKLSKSEIPANHPLAAHFGMMDTDGNGSLSKSEFAKHHDGM